MPSGVVIVDKPKGPTSHDVVAVLRRTFRTRQVGHCGTLDPMATGVLVVAVDEGTKLVPFLTSEDKGYEATLRLGVTTDTLDAEGTVTDERSLSGALEEALRHLATDASETALAPLLRDALRLERGRSEQVPPVFSAVRIDGERAHVLARRGEAPVMPSRPVGVVALEILGGGIAPEPHLRLRLAVTKGYFVRSLARDLAEALGTVGHLTALRRTRSGAFDLSRATSVDALFPADGRPVPVEDPAREAIRLSLLPLANAASMALPVSRLTAQGVLFAGHGKRVAASDLEAPHPTPSAWLDAEGALVAIGEAAEDGTGRVLRGFPRPG